MRLILAFGLVSFMGLSIVLVSQLTDAAKIISSQSPTQGRAPRREDKAAANCAASCRFESCPEPSKFARSALKEAQVAGSGPSSNRVKGKSDGAGFESGSVRTILGTDGRKTQVSRKSGDGPR